MKIESQLGTPCNAGLYKQPQGLEQKQELCNGEWVTDTGFTGGWTNRAFSLLQWKRSESRIRFDLIHWAMPQWWCHWGKMIQRQLSPTIGPSDLQVQESSVLDQTCLSSLPKHRENENMKLLANKAFERAFQWPYGLWDTKSQKRAVAFFFFFFLLFLSFWRLNFLFCFPLIIFQGFVFTHQNDRKFSVCVSFKFGLNLIFRIRHLFFRLPPWQPSPAFLYIVIQRPLSSWPLYHNLVHPSQRTLLMTEARRCRSPWPGDFQGVIKRRK